MEATKKTEVALIAQGVVKSHCGDFMLLHNAADCICIKRIGMATRFMLRLMKLGQHGLCWICFEIRLWFPSIARAKNGLPEHLNGSPSRFRITRSRHSSNAATRKDDPWATLPPSSWNKVWISSSTTKTNRTQQVVLLSFFIAKI